MVLLLVISMAVTSCQWPWQASDSSAAAPSETTLSSEGGTINVEGIEIQAPPGAAPEGTRLTADLDSGDLSSGLGEEFQAASTPVQIRLGDGLQPSKPLVVSIPIDRTKLVDFDPKAPGLAVVVRSDGDEALDLVGGTWDPVAGTLTAEVPHLSLIQAIRFDVGAWVNNVKSTMLQSLGIEYPEPSCNDKPVTISEVTYSVISQWAHWTCLASAGGALTAAVHSNSPIPFMVTSHPTVAGRVTTDFSRSGIMTAAFANSLGFSGNNNGEAVMFPGGSVAFTFNEPGQDTSLGFRQLPEILLLSVLTQSLDEAFDKFGQKLYLDKLSGLACWGNIVNTSLDPTLSAETASGIVKSVLSCIEEIAELTFAGKVILLLVSAAPSAFAGMFLGLVTTLRGEASFAVPIDSSGPPLRTFSDPEMGISFRYPAEWTVSKPTDPRIKTGATVLDQTGSEIARVNFNTAFDFAPCASLRPYQLLDSTIVNIPGMDISSAPTTVKTELVDVGAQSSFYSDGKPIRLGMALYSGPGQPPGTTEVCNAGGVIQSAAGRFGFFSADRGFNSTQEAAEFLNTEEYEQIKTMLASFRFL